MKLLYPTLFIILFPFIHYSQISEVINTDPHQNLAIQKYYTPAELKEIQTHHPEKWNTLIYYYTQSFIIEEFECEECLPFIAGQFDISTYEHLRQKESRIKKETKYGVIVTLLSVDELEHKLPIHAPQIPLEDEE